MAGNYLSSRGVNLDEVMSKIQFAESEPREAQDRGPLPVSRVTNARLPRQPVSTFWDLAIERGRIASLSPHDEAGPDLKGLPGVLDACGRLLAPSLCHAHIHLDKCFLLQDPKFIDLEIVQGDFGEAMSLTSHAKSRFEEDDLLRRGRRLIEESIEAGVTAMRAFVEVDTIVEMKCVDAGLQLKNEFEGRCDVQICVFAQLPLFSGEDDGDANRALMTRGLGKEGVDAVGSTPYVESSEEKQLQNIRWTIERAMQHRKHLDFHLDYNLEIKTAADAKIWYVVDKIKDEGWREQTVTCGHCTALTLLDDQELRELRRATEECPISFVGLPTSDLFMMDRPEAPRYGSKGQRQRGTLQIMDMLHHGFNVAIGVNNVGNAFTPWGDCDPLTVASLGVGVYQASTKEQTALLYECVSSRAKGAIGMEATTLDLKPGEPADLVLFGAAEEDWRRRKSIAEVVYDPGHTRTTIKGGRIVSSSEY